MSYTQKLTFSMMVPTVMVAGAGSAVALGAWWIHQEALKVQSDVIAGYLEIGGWGAGILTLVCVLACLGVTVWIRRTALQVLGGDPSLASDILAHMADGELHYRIPAAPAGSLLDSVQRVATMLEATLGAIGQASTQVTAVSQEIDRDNRDLSERTDQTVGQLTTTARHVEEVTLNVRQSSEAAHRVTAMALQACDVAKRGGQAVGQVVSTMQEINQSSQKIADIIGVIDGIAFQTNILALNAAVEAARAGEQGRGFAVVASEVRSLAGRSAVAAREIKALIDTSVSKVEAGSSQVQHALSTMDDIVNSVQQVSDTVAGISALAQEQSGGMDDVNSAIHGLESIARQNEETAVRAQAASHTLQEQASLLMQAVSTFKP
ncbi:methyl-accepting chemotaxis protein [Rhodoferax sp.]|uniref:methyl-accepting chemotaxis protein n=1 Tax=Rhodoferax sp. TaxID=50421 RepID=UPI002851AFE1|nr:methyl-accepting chemotaxis protein [Rhodoferax sp.]MDR3370854.1 methyl-accepting chemotaxis protein [Rhodoferax sp.]